MFERLRDFFTSRRFVVILTVLVGIVAVVYMLFITLIFDPFEDDLEDMAALVPREVDYFVRWQGIGSRFDGFPEPAAWVEISDSEVYREWKGSGGEADFDEQFGVSKIFADLEQMTSLTPAGLSLENDLLREVALAGNGKMGLGTSFDGLLMMRVSFKVKAGVSMLDFDFVRNKLPESLGIESLGDQQYRLPSFEPFGFRDAYLARSHDVLLLASSREWLNKAHELEVKSGEDSLALASVFHDNVTAYLAEKDQPIEIFMRWEKLRSELPHWPQIDGTEGYVTRAFGSFFDTNLLRYLAGYWLTGDRFEIKFSGEVDATQSRTDFQREWIESKHVSVNRIHEFAGMIPAESFFFAAFSGRPDEVMIQLEGALDPEMRRLLDELASGTGHYNGMVDLLRTLAQNVQPGLFLAMRRNDYQEKTGDNKVEHDDAPVPAIAILAKASGTTSYEDLQKMLEGDLSRLLDGEVRQWILPLSGGSHGKSFSSPAIPGTGEIVLVNLPSKNAIAITNSWDYATEINVAAMTSSSSAKASKIKLGRSDGFREAVDSLNNGASLFAWFDPSASWQWIDKLSQAVADNQFNDWMDTQYSGQRPGITQRLSQEMFGTTGRLSAEQQSQLINSVDEALSALARDEKAQRLPQLAADFRKALLPLKMLDWASFGLKTSRKAASVVISGELEL
jgi:hypothetical protein